MGAANLLLRDIAGRADISAPERTSLREVIHLIHRNGVGAAVLLREETPLGILTERDVVGLLHAGVDLDAPAERFSIKALLAASGDRTIGHALNLMIENNVRRLVVVDAAGRFLGLVTQRGLVRHLEDDFYRSALRVKHLLEKARALVSCVPGETIRTALDRMVTNRISSIPVVEAGRAVGIITEKDVVRLADDGTSLEDAVAAHMSKPVITVSLEVTVVEVVKIMGDRNIRRVVVTDPEGQCLWILTERDLVRNLESDYSEFLERKLRYGKEVLNLLPEMLVEIVDTGNGQFVLWANERVLARFGRAIVDRPVEELVPAETWGAVYADLLENGRVEDVRYKREDSVYELSGFYLSFDRVSDRGRAQLILRDITEDVTLATTDGLTALYNRRYMNECLAKELERSRRTSRAFSVAIADIDDFKRVNDLCGHVAGDRVLRAVAELLGAGLREYDSAGRYGGEEFLVIMPETGPLEALLVAERLRAAVEGHRFDGIRVPVAVSIGVASYPGDGTTAEDLLVRADERLYVAKRSGKNRVEGSPPVPEAGS